MLILLILILLGALLQAFSLHDGLSHVDFDVRTSVSETEPEETFSVETRITNTGILPILSLRASCFYPAAMQLPVPAEVDSGRFARISEERFWLWGRQRLIRSMEVSIGQRGLHYIRGAKLMRGDFLGLYSVSREFPVEREILVYPGRREDPALKEQLGHFLGDMPARRLLMRDPILTISAREYTGQEPMHDISWGQTARRGRLMSREFDYTRDYSCGLILCVDGVQVSAQSGMDMAAAMARTAAEALLSHGIAVNFITNCALSGCPVRECTSVRAEGRISAELLGILARAYGLGICTPLELADRLLRREHGSAAFIVVTLQETDRIREMCDWLRQTAGTDCLLLAAEQRGGGVDDGNL